MRWGASSWPGVCKALARRQNCHEEHGRRWQPVECTMGKLGLLQQQRWKFCLKPSFHVPTCVETESTLIALTSNWLLARSHTLQDVHLGWICQPSSAICCAFQIWPTLYEFVCWKFTQCSNTILLDVFGSEACSINSGIHSVSMGFRWRLHAQSKYYLGILPHGTQKLLMVKHLLSDGLTLADRKSCWWHGLGCLVGVVKGTFEVGIWAFGQLVNELYTSNVGSGSQATFRDVFHFIHCLSLQNYWNYWMPDLPRR